MGAEQGQEVEGRCRCVKFVEEEQGPADQQVLVSRAGCEVRFTTEVRRCCIGPPYKASSVDGSTLASHAKPLGFFDTVQAANIYEDLELFGKPITHTFNWVLIFSRDAGHACVSRSSSPSLTAGTCPGHC